MPVFETSAGRRIQLSLPRTKWKEFEEAAEAYRKLVREKKATSTRLRTLVGKRERAINEDRIALAKAIREGKSDPGDKAVEQVEKEIAACNRRLEALEHALDEAETDLIDVLDEHREEWLEEAKESLTAARDAYAETVEALAQAREKVSATWGLAYFIEHFPEEVISYKPGTAVLPNLRAQNSEPYYFAQVVEAMRADAKEAEPAPVIPFGRAADEMLDAQNGDSA